MTRCFYAISSIAVFFTLSSVPAHATRFKIRATAKKVVKHSIKTTLKTSMFACMDVLNSFDAYPKVYETAYLAKEERFNSRKTKEVLDYLKRSEFLSADEVHAHQVASLKTLLVHAGKNTEYYKNIFAEAGFNPEAVRERADLLKLPVLSKLDLRKNTKLLLAKEMPSGINGPNIVKKTSGSTGEPTVIQYSANSEEWKQAYRLLGWGWAGYGIGEKTFLYWGAAYEKPSRAQRVKMGIDRALKNERYFDSLRQDVESNKEAIRQFRAFKPKVLIAFPQSLAILAQWVNENGLRDWDDVPVIAGGEAVLDRDRLAIQRAFGPVFETYGCREMMLLGAECEFHNGMHLTEENVLTEVTRDGGSELAAPGEPGNVVTTDLHNYAMPLIRYENGDLAKIMDESSVCDCGRNGLRRLECVVGRRADTMRAKDGSTVPGIAFHQAFSYTAGDDAVRRFQVHQKADGSVTVKVVRGKKFQMESVQRMVDIASSYLKGQKVELVFVDDIPVQVMGKFKNVIVDPAE